MKARVTSIAWTEASERISQISSEMENALAGLFSDVSFGAGVDHLMIVIVAPSSDDNERFNPIKDGIQTHRIPFSKQSFKGVTLTALVDHDAVMSAKGSGLRKLICEAALRKIENPEFRIPRVFDYKSFAALLSTAIMIFSRARPLRAPSRRRRRTAVKAAK